MPLNVDEVKIPEDSDFQEFRDLCDHSANWDLVYSNSKKCIHVWTKATERTAFKMIKAHVRFSDVSAAIVYDVLHDSEYRRHWDRYMLEGVDVGFINPNNDICYYSLKSPPPFRSRDFVLQRSWLETQNEMLILNHSVCHEDFPPRKGVIRGTSFITGYMIRPAPSSGCVLFYVTQSDPGGVLPSWAVNKLAEVVTPSVIRKLHKACQKYEHWKAKHNPNVKPWRFPEQISGRRVDLTKCVPCKYANEVCDESSVPLSDLGDTMTNGDETVADESDQ